MLTGRCQLYRSCLALPEARHASQGGGEETHESGGEAGHRRRNVDPQRLPVSEVPALNGGRTRVAKQTKASRWAWLFAPRNHRQRPRTGPDSATCIDRPWRRDDERYSRRSFSTLGGRFRRLGRSQPRPSPWLRAAGANEDIRLAVVGVGSRVKIGGQGRNEIRSFLQVPGVRIVALCDVDQANLGPEVESFQKRNEQVAAYTDVRKLLDSKDIDAVVVTTPNHWHALVTIWACQAGKDVYVQKPASYNIFEGRKMVEAAGKYHRIVQCPNGSRLQRLRGSAGFRAPGKPRQGRDGSPRAFFTPRQHRQSERPAAGPVHARLRSLVRSGSDPAADAPELALRLALAMALRQRRAGELGDSSPGWLPHVRRRRAAAARHQHRRAVRLRG